jgi:hypothetical protein
MRKVIVGAMVSMDGVMQAPGGPEEDPTGGFKFGGWVAPFADIDPVFGEEIGKLFGEPFDLLLAAGLVDELRTFTFPVLLGKGKRLFGDDSQPRAFELTHSAVSPNGLIATTYVRAGEVKTATVSGAEEPTSAELARREKLKREG